MPAEIPGTTATWSFDNPETVLPIGHVLLIPGLLEPPAAMWPLKWRMGKRCDSVEFFQDRIVFRDLEQSIERLSRIITEPDGGRSIAIVTHSFGDWVARQAIARSPDHRVSTLVSVAPVMRGGLMPAMLGLVSGPLIPEVRVILNSKRAAENLDCDRRLRRLVIWPILDEAIRPVPLDHIPNVRVERFIATHATVILQPNVLKRIEQFLFGKPDSKDQQTDSQH